MSTTMEMTSTHKAPTPQMTAEGHAAFYEALITRNKLVIDDSTQAMFKNGKFLVAGCGSIGSAIVEPLVRIGAENISIAEPDPFELSNLNRQAARIQDVGVNKALAVIDQVKAISPYVKFKTYLKGLQPDNMADALDGVKLIFDGVDVTGLVPLHVKTQMHELAKERKIPVISGYDIAGLQMCVIYRYDLPGTKVLHGKVKLADFDKGMRPMDFLFKVIPLRFIPYEIFAAVGKMLAGEQLGFPQVVYTAKSYGNMALAAAIEIMNGRPTKKYVSYDHHDAVRPWHEKIRIEIKRLTGLAKLLGAYFKGK